MQFSLFYFSSKLKKQSNYNLLWESAKFADRNGFSAIWTPERHFDEFGAPFPSPALTTAALAMITSNIHLRAGSVVLPLQNPIRVAEEWAMLDHFSCGRTGICLASGWHAQDFSLAPHNYLNRKKIMLEGFEAIKTFWKGKEVSLPGGENINYSVKTYPQPLQKKIPFWFAASGHVDTFTLAAENEVGLLTHLLGQNISELKEKIIIYKKRLAEKTDWSGHVTLMLHAFVGKDQELVRAVATPHLKAYLKTAMKLEAKQSRYKSDLNGDDISEEDMDAILDYAVKQFCNEKSLIGTIGDLLNFVKKIDQIGVDEVACLIDFGIDDSTVLEHLIYLNQLRILSC